LSAILFTAEIYFDRGNFYDFTSLGRYFLELIFYTQMHNFLATPSIQDIHVAS